MIDLNSCNIYKVSTLGVFILYWLAGYLQKKQVKPDYELFDGSVPRWREIINGIFELYPDQVLSTKGKAWKRIQYFSLFAFIALGSYLIQLNEKGLRESP